MKKDNRMIKLNPSFQRELFTRVIRKYKDSFKASEVLKFPASSIRAYKNLYFKSIPRRIIQDLIKHRIMNSSELDKNILSYFNKKDQIRSSLNKGRELRKNHFKKLKEKIPSLREIISSNKIDVLKWFKSYQHLLNTPFRKLNVQYEKDYFILTYKNFAKKEFREFSVKIPNSFSLDEDFIYFFGLWCGDRSGGKRFGVCNKNNEILNFTEKFLKQQYQNIEKILTISKGVKEPKLNYDKKFVINHDKKGWVLSIHSNNGILSSFFYYLQSQLDFFLLDIQKKEIFFAGLFDAEGNVSLYNKSFRWACKNNSLIKIYSKHLKDMGLFERYDGNCLISYNLSDFYKQIFPYLKHKDKLNKTLFLCTGKGNLPVEHLKILTHLKKEPKKTAQEIAKALKKNKIYSELRLLTDFGFISSNGYPHRFEIALKGIKSLGD
ncbi:MAG TPA: hypothetical protein VMZ91_02575 [Candidatus Paceibacterota bacterium]|nr:hypothetical protein [Candidatus Paceibacterota bacterium]